VGDEYFMALALEQAQRAQASGEVPVGAVLVDGHGQVLGFGANAVIRLSDPTAHAEILALREAAKQIGNYRLVDTTLYVTLEPCAMCLGALFHARVSRIVFGAYDPKTGACGSRLDLTVPELINFHAQVQGGVMAQQCGHVLTEFFKRKRQEKSLFGTSVGETSAK
jgi:tRNA(adenine34) deaminase